MQDLRTGNMVPLDPKFLEGLGEQKGPFESWGNVNDQLQRAKDAAIPQREAHGPIFSVGEVIEIRGGKFRVHAISGRRLYLDSLPKDK